MQQLQKSTITLTIDAEAAKVFQTSSDDDKEKLQILVSSLFKQYSQANLDSLKNTMNEISQKAQARGLTPEILESILEDEELEQKDLERSAKLYAEIYEEDKDLQELTESALICEIE